MKRNRRETKENGQRNKRERTHTNTLMKETGKKMEIKEKGKRKKRGRKEKENKKRKEKRKENGTENIKRDK